MLIQFETVGVCPIQRRSRILRGPASGYDNDGVAAQVVGHVDPEHRAHLVRPRRGQVGRVERALDELELELEAQDDVQRVGQLVGLDADERRRDDVDRLQEVLEAVDGEV